MREQEKNNKEYMIFLTLKPSQSFFVYSNQSKEKKIRKKRFLRSRGSRRWNKKRKGFLTSLATTIKKDSTTSIRKLANELKVQEKTVRTTIQQNLSPDLNPLDLGRFRKQNKLTIQILVRLRLLLRRNGIKCLKNFF